MADFFQSKWTFDHADKSLRPQIVWKKTLIWFQNETLLRQAKLEFNFNLNLTPMNEFKLFATLGGLGLSE